MAAVPFWWRALFSANGAVEQVAGYLASRSLCVSTQLRSRENPHCREHRTSNPLAGCKLDRLVHGNSKLTSGHNTMGLAATESQLQANRALWAPLARSGGLSDLFARPQPAASTCWSRKRQVVAVVVASCVHHPHNRVSGRTCRCTLLTRQRVESTPTSVKIVRPSARCQDAN